MAQTTIDDIVTFLGLTDLVDSDGDTATFKDEDLADYSSDLNTVYKRFEAVVTAVPDAARMLLGQAMTDGLADLGVSDGGLFDSATYYLGAISTLYDRISGINADAGAAVSAAWQSVDTAITETKAKAAEAAGGGEAAEGEEGEAEEPS